MLPGSSLDALAARWAARPEPGVFAALAEGLAKRGDLAEAGRVAAAGLARYPGHAAGLIAQARIAIATGDKALAIRALAVLLERDPGHPLAREMATGIAPHLVPVDVPAAESVTSDEAGALPVEPVGEDDGTAPTTDAAGEPQGGSPEAPIDRVITLDLPGQHEPAVPEDEVAEDEVAEGPGAPATASTDEADDGAPIVTESLAELYHRQGHLEEALAAYAELAARDPSNDTVAARHEAVRRELATQRPLPFDAHESAGRSVSEWLGAVAAARPPAGAAEASFDAFYEPPPAPADATADFDAFQRWLQELGR